MKKFFWITMFWVLVIFLFRSYVRLFDRPLAREVGSRFGVYSPVCLTGSLATGSVLTGTDVAQQLSDIQAQLMLINQKIQSQPEAPIQNAIFQTTAPTKVGLYYFNEIQDQKLPPEQQINIDSILPVYRIFPASKNLLVDTINELIK